MRHSEKEPEPDVAPNIATGHSEPLKSGKRVLL